MVGNPRSRRGSRRADLATLKLQPRRAVPVAWAITAQTVAALGCIFAASHVFVGQLEWAGPALGLPATVVALLLSPIATELPGHLGPPGQDPARAGEHLGAMTIQATVPSGLGLLFTTWKFDAPLLASGIATMVAMVFLLVTIRAGRLTPGRLSWTGAVYLAFAATLPALM